MVSDCLCSGVLQLLYLCVCRNSNIINGVDLLVLHAR